MEGENKLTARFLQARIEALRKALVERFENIVSATLQAYSELPTTSSTNETAGPPSYVDTAAEQVKLEVESTSLVRMAEEIMALTRSLKDLWLFGGLKTLRGTDGDKVTGDEKMQEDVSLVCEAVRGYLTQRAERTGDNHGRSGHANANDATMNMDSGDRT